MQPEIYLEGTGTPVPAAVEQRAVAALNSALLERFGGVFTLQRAYLDYLAADEDDVEGMAYATNGALRAPTAFEAAFEELAPKVHASLGLPADQHFACAPF
jgi:hypothetical protein